MIKRYLYLAHRIFLDDVTIKKGGADYIIDSISSHNFVYKIDLKLNEYSEHERDINIIRASISYKNRDRIVYVKKFSNINFFFKFIHEFFLINFFLANNKNVILVCKEIEKKNDFFYFVKKDLKLKVIEIKNDGKYGYIKFFFKKYE